MEKIGWCNRSDARCTYLLLVILGIMNDKKVSSFAEW